MAKKRQTRVTKKTVTKSKSDSNPKNKTTVNKKVVSNKPSAKLTSSKVVSSLDDTQSLTLKKPVSEFTSNNNNNNKAEIKPGFPIVGIGASAGGLEALENFFKAMPVDSSIGFVLVVHLDPTHISILPELLQKHTSMRVCQVTDGVQVKPNQVYVIPPNKNLTILHGQLHLMDLTKPRGVNLPIDSFFRSLAQDQECNAVCIILSGTGTDGTLGVKAIKGEMGVVMVQDEESAKYEGMPRSAIATGLADYILPPEKMPEQLINYTKHVAHRSAVPHVVPVEGTIPNALQKIFVILRTHTNHDFSLYKKNTICRRIERRMNIHQISDISDYVRYLQESKHEVDILFKELLIGVTNFFRDPAAFEYLQTQILPELLTNKTDDQAIRVWVPGCASGEEAYSIAILLDECMEQIGKRYHIQVFGTDIDERAINFARAGIYPECILGDVGPERIEHYFVREDGRYRINKQIREMLVFALQNVIKDPPFTKLDLLCCRNLLIYLSTELQKKLLPIFHYSLKPNGILFLGSSETIGSANDLFALRQKKWKIFNRKPATSSNRPVILTFPAVPTGIEDHDLTVSRTIQKAEELSALQLVEAILQQSDTPPCAIINDACSVIYIHGRTGKFLEPAEGKASVNIIEMARPGIKADLAAAIRQVTTNKQEVIHRGLKVEHFGGQLYLNMTVRPILEQVAMHGLMMVIFEETESPTKPVERKSRSITVKNKGKSTEQIELELMYTKENLQTTIEELETSNEELKSTNEELQSTNEELQSTNEEMETSKEELQSLNEESATINAELQARIDELSQINDDMKNLLDSTGIATVFLDSELCIRRFTPNSTEIIPLTATDQGRPIKHLASTLVNIDIENYCQKVLDTLTPQEIEAECRNGNYCVMKIRPYRTLTNVIDGVVITFEDITVHKQQEQAKNKSELLYRTLFELANDSILLIDAQTGCFVETNAKAHEHLGYTPEEFAKMTIFDIEVTKSAEGIAKQLENIVSRGNGAFKTRHKTRNGKIYDVLVKTKAITIDEKKFIVSTWHNIAPVATGGQTVRE